MATFAKICTYAGIEGCPMHWHEPHQYWQWPWERHNKAEAAHSLHAVENPIWVKAETSDPTKPSTVVIEATKAMKETYAQSLDATSAVAIRVTAEYKAYNTRKASERAVRATAPVAAVEVKADPLLVAVTEHFVAKERRTEPRTLVNA